MKYQMNRYSKEILDYVKEHYPTEQTKDIAEHLGLSTKEISNIASKKLKIKKVKDFKTFREDANSVLNSEQKQFILDNYSIMKTSEIAEILNVPKERIRGYATANKLEKSKDVNERLKWTDEQIKYVKENYHNTNSDEMCKYLECALGSLRALCHTLGITKDDDFHIYSSNGSLTQEQKEFIFENYATMKTSQIAKALGLTYTQIHGYASNRGLKKTKFGAKHYQNAWQEYLEDKKGCNNYDFVCKLIEPKIDQNMLYKSKYGKYYINENYFNTIDNEWKAYWLGFLYADGCVKYKRNNKKNNKLEIGLTMSLAIVDKEHLIKLKNSLQSDTVIKEKDVKLNGKIFKSCKIGFWNKQLTEDLIRLGCVPNKSLILKFPNEDVVPKHLIRHFIRGYFDGDGCVHINIDKKHCSTSFVGTEDVLTHIRDIIEQETGITCAIARKDKRNQAYQIMYSGVVKNELIFKYLYKDCNIFLDRKFDKFNTLYCLD